ncbi:MAG TPA: phosphate ABC transporter permease PstA [Pseudonocardia sp.]|jgi:phosphate ABC transporter permease subunit PstA|nr:phosphate ABC transporter permease PstA [Pseudonocardia sp.]
MTAIGDLTRPGPPHRRLGRPQAKGDRTVASVAFLIALWLSLLVALTFLVTLLVTTFLDGLVRLDANLLTQYSSQLFPERAGARAAILGTLWVIGTTIVLTVPLGVSAAIYLEEFGDPSKWYFRLVELNIQNLAAVPSIIYGLLTLGVASVLAPLLGLRNVNAVIFGAIALTLLILPVVIIATRESLRAVPAEIRAGSLALGATPWQTVWRQTLPAAVPGIATGTILAVSRAIGEAAPLLLLGAYVFVTFDPNGLFSSFTTMPVQIYNWTSQPQIEFQQVASAGIILLLFMLLLLNGVAILIRNKLQRRW